MLINLPDELYFIIFSQFKILKRKLISFDGSLEIEIRATIPGEVNFIDNIFKYILG